VFQNQKPKGGMQMECPYFSHQKEAIELNLFGRSFLIVRYLIRKFQYVFSGIEHFVRHSVHNYVAVTKPLQPGYGYHSSILNPAYKQKNLTFDETNRSSLQRLPVVDLYAGLMTGLVIQRNVITSLPVIIAIILIATDVFTCCDGFTVRYRDDTIVRYQIRQQQMYMKRINTLQEEMDTHNLLGGASTRSRFLQKCVVMVVPTMIVLTSTMMQPQQPVHAMEQATAEDTIWMTGKMPKIPGQTPKDKNDLTGTRKDPNFLRSLSDCKNQCENMTGSVNNNGYAKEKNECLSECQDICCTTYQQCTFPIVQRI
jgi:hypothetical protein